MLQLMIAVIKHRNTHPGSTRPLDARSLALSTLLGTHPPVLPGRSLVALAALFGIAAGTMRTALSRLVAAGEVRLVDGRYELAGPLLDRQHAQDTGRRAPAADWNGWWHTVVVTDDRRPIGERRRFRATMHRHRMGELRPDVWMRPANLAPPEVEPGWILTTGPIETGEPGQPTGSLWDLRSIATVAHSLLAELETLAADLDWTTPESIPPAFTVSASVVRFLRTEPLLPPALVGADWPVETLRLRYDEFERRFQAALGAYLRTRG